MKKQFLDFMYEQRSSVQIDIDKLVELSKTPQVKCCDNMNHTNPSQVKLDAKRDHIYCINMVIENYLDKHK